MNYDRDKSKEQLIDELEALRKEKAELTNWKLRWTPLYWWKKQSINHDLAEQEAWYRSLVEDHPCSLLLFLQDTTIIFVNNHLVASMGYSPEQLKGRQWILPEDERNQFHLMFLLSQYSVIGMIKKRFGI